LNTAWGGSIVEVSLDGTNFVNAHDTGREVQPALYDGAAQYDNCAGCTGNWGWNPVLGGDRYDHGSPVLTSQLASDSIYVKAQPLEWYPDNKGGGPNTPIESDTYFEETASLAPGAPLAFKVHFVLTHFGTDQHYNSTQEFPAVYVNASLPTLAFYGGTNPWTNDVVTTTSAPALPAPQGFWYSSEQWAAYAGSNNLGLTVFVPVPYPYVSAFSSPAGGGSGSTGNATNYLHQFTALTAGPGAMITGDVYLIPGDYTAARSLVYELHQTLPASDIFTPFGNVDAPSANETISGNNFQISGWTIDNVAVSSVEIFVDSVLIGNAPLTIDRPDVVAAFPNAPLQCGWSFRLDSTTLTNGAHTITVEAADTSNNVAIFPPIPVTVSNRMSRVRPRGSGLT